MKIGKRLPALVLALCLLLSVSLSALAVGPGSGDPAQEDDFRLIGALPITANVDTPAPGCDIHTNKDWRDRGILLYYNELLAINRYDQSRKTLMVVDENDQCVKYKDKWMLWNLDGQEYVGTSTTWQLRGYMVKIFTGHSDFEYNGSVVATWTQIIDVLANSPELAGKGCRLQIRLYDKSNTAATQNGFVDPQKSVSGKSLKATGYDVVDGERRGDFACIELGTVEKGATRITRTNALTLNRVEMLDQENMQLTFSQPATIDPARTDAALQVLGSDGSVISSFPVALSEGGSRKVDARMSGHTWADVQEALGANANSTVRLLLTEKDVAASRDERYNNFAVDTIWNTDTDMPLLGHLAHLPELDAAGNGLTPDYVYASVIAPSAPLGEDFNGTYNFMNADTGRSLVVGDTDEITIAATGAQNSFTFKIGDKFVDLSGNQPTLVDDSRAYTLRLSNTKQRYQILLGEDQLLADSDEGDSSAASLEILSKDVLQTGWYLTRSGEQRPLRVMPVGDSITWGVNPDQGAPYYGYRAELSTLLLDYFGRVVFVGDQVTTTQSIDSNILTRHFGYSGYTVYNRTNDPVHPDFWGNGSSVYLPATVDKYLPDVACLMLGINDIGIMGLGSQDIPAESFTKENGLLDRYQEFVEALAAHMTADEDTVFCSTLTPLTPAASGSDTANNNVNRYNPLLRERITRMAAEGLPVVENDNNSACDTRETDLSSDRIHLSAQGYSKVAQRYAESIQKVYESTGVKRSYEVSLNAANGMGMSYTNKPYYNGNFTFSLEIPANLTGTPVVKVNGQTVEANNGAYTVTGVTEDLEIEVTGLTVKTFKVTVPEVEGVNYEIINTAEGAPATLPVPYGTPIDLRIWLDEPYDQSELSVKVNGEPMEMTKDAFGTYYLSLGELTEDKTVLIDGVALNIWNVTEGANSSFKVGEGEDLTLVTDNAYLRPLLVTLDGRELTEGEDYEVVGTESDTFNIILKKAFIDSLEAGEYGIGIHYPNGLAETTLTITAPPAPPTPTPPTSAEAAPAVFAGLGLLAVIGLGSALVLRKKTR